MSVKSISVFHSPPAKQNQYANVMGMPKDIGMKGQDFTWGATAFFIAYTAAELPQGAYIPTLIYVYLLIKSRNSNPSFSRDQSPGREHLPLGVGSLLYGSGENLCTNDRK